MKKLLIGTTNLAKFNDYKELLKDFNLELVSLYQLKVPAPKETGKDFEENAVLKANYYFKKTGIPTLADAGGFEIDALLNGKNGIMGHKGEDEELIAEVFKRIKNEQNRKCRIRVIMALASPLGVATADSAVEGVIADKPSEKRVKGYPYRSVMFFPNYGKYYTDLDTQELEIMNHRKAAFEKIKDILQELSK
jgi:XTP/dITP diphosphohydrolase